MVMDQVLRLCNNIASNLPVVDESDLSPLGAILSDLEEIIALDDAPSGLKTMAGRAASLTRHIIMGETELTAGCEKLGECVSKMMVNIGKTLERRENLPDEKDAEDEAAWNGRGEISSEPDETPLVEIKDLLLKFANNQQAVLEDFEKFILDMERGNQQAVEAIRRILHTWKGEFGVLELQEYSALIHQVEERFQNDQMTIDGFFRLKDYLASKMPLFANGIIQPVSEDDLLSIFSSNTSEKSRESGFNKSKTESIGTDKDSKMPPEKTESNLFQGDPSMMGDFITESRDHIHSAETLLLELETDFSNSECINGIFRAWHTIKGIAGFLGLKEINHLAHTMENMIDKVRKNELILDSCHIDILLESNDCLKDFLQAIELAISGGEYKIPSKYHEVIEKLSSPRNQERIQLATKVKPEQKIGEILVENGLTPRETVENALVKQSKGDERKLGEILISEGHVSVKTVAGVLADQNSARQIKSIEETIRVPVNRIDQIVDTIGEAVIAQSMINASPAILNLNDQILHTKIAHANMIMRQIQEMAMSLRMVSIKSTFQKMARLARDLGKKFDRDIEFVTEGEDTELDKSVVENIGDPLIHMIRNSVDHGVEPPEERERMGKPRKALVRLRAYHRAGNIIIEIMDDGRGLDREAIYQKALSKGLCNPEDHLSDQELYQFIFLPGFSTAKKITDVSGRGVGMDVVKRNVEALHGSVEIMSIPGKGTTFNIRLPLTLAIVDGMIVRSGKDSYIIPTLAILKSLQSSVEKIEPVLGRGKMVKVRGELISVVHLASLFNANGHVWEHTSGVVMIVEDMLGKKIGLHVDEIVGQQQVVVKSLGNGIGDIPGITGGAIMSDGTVSLIIDIGGIVKMAGI